MEGYRGGTVLTYPDARHMTRHSANENPPLTAQRKADAAWYDEFYKTQQIGLSPWYRFLLPELRKTIRPTTKLIELGCGQGHILRILSDGNLLPQQNITGVDQSKTAVEYCAGLMPKARFLTGDIYELKDFQHPEFDVCLLMETIEHLEQPARPITNIWRILKPEGLLFVSFPNYMHFPWLLVRILAQKLNRPNWIVLQPVDKIYTTFGVIRIFRSGGFEFVKGIGSNYGPPVLHPLETDGITRFLNLVRLWRFSFHPILIFRKPESELR